MAKITIDELKHIAKLAKLSFSEEELLEFEKEFNNILEYVSMIKECDTSDIEFEHYLADYKGDVLNQDVTKPSIPNKKILQNATDGRSKNGYIKTSKIVNKE